MNEEGIKKKKHVILIDTAFDVVEDIYEYLGSIPKGAVAYSVYSSISGTALFEKTSPYTPKSPFSRFLNNPAEFVRKDDADDAIFR